ncbi:probable inactive 2-oxoglutarate-dependent dioxygenase AOP2 [Malania oleifera]|uniref:probable inactive 2-oxoglutarate-dependent dioxygenase AOP2 n=1 Tax=Malania oleifera TaxID=397392 RepID=UPI0025AE9A3F|nr:probable inactive 2-oxoglutarate-dependent dioxygenase AOP2 [Malania oleifera]
MGIQTQPKILVIYFSKEDWKPGTPAWLFACNEVRHALEEYDCFVALSNNTVSPELHQQVFQSSEESFDLPREIKAQNTYDKSYHGVMLRSEVARLAPATNHFSPLKEKSSSSEDSDGDDKFVEIAKVFSSCYEESTSGNEDRSYFDGESVQRSKKPDLDAALDALLEQMKMP